MSSTRKGLLAAAEQQDTDLRKVVRKATRVDDLPLMLTVDETCPVLGLGRGTVYGLIREGVIPSVKLGRSVRVPRAALERMLDGEA